MLYIYIKFTRNSHFTGKKRQKLQVCGCWGFITMILQPHHQVLNNKREDGSYQMMFDAVA